jgi:hypothetical protein
VSRDFYSQFDNWVRGEAPAPNDHAIAIYLVDFTEASKGWIGVVDAAVIKHAASRLLNLWEPTT